MSNLLQPFGVLLECEALLRRVSKLKTAEDFERDAKQYGTSDDAARLLPRIREALDIVRAIPAPEFAETKTTDLRD